MDAQTSVNLEEGIQVLLLHEEDCTGLWKQVAPLIEEGHRAFVLDFERIGYLNSMSIAAIISLRNKVLAAGGSIAMCHANDNIISVFRILRLEKLFDLQLDRRAAIAALRG